jgi:hypothetical protein
MRISLVGMLTNLFSNLTNLPQRTKLLFSTFTLNEHSITNEKDEFRFIVTSIQNIHETLLVSITTSLQNLMLTVLVGFICNFTAVLLFFTFEGQIMCLEGRIVRFGHIQSIFYL